MLSTILNQPQYSNQPTHSPANPLTHSLTQQTNNSQTDIKEAVFLGQDDSLVACGSDDGYVFIYDAQTGVGGGVLAVAVWLWLCGCVGLKMFCDGT